ncbi:unnamed protein product, partial [Adineta steineri]
QIQGIKRPYDSNPTTTNAGYQPVAKKKKGVPIVGTTLRELIHTSVKLEPATGDSRRVYSILILKKLCSITLSNNNVYACLVCGKYFQGRGQKSCAYTHSVEGEHHVFINLHSLQFFCLPDTYEIIDSSLEYIK